MMDQECLESRRKKHKRREDEQQQQAMRSAGQKAIERPPSEDCLNAIN